MRLNAPRIEPVDLGRLDADQRAALEPFLASDGGKVGGGRILNIFRTLAHAPKALTAFLGWGNYILSKRNALTPRDRELVILRTGYNCLSGYEWTQHRRIGLDCGLTEDEIERIKTGPDAAGWRDIDRRADRGPFRCRRDLGGAGAARRQGAHGSGDDRRSVHAGFDDAQQLRHPGRSGLGRRSRSARLTIGARTFEPDYFWGETI